MNERLKNKAYELKMELDEYLDDTEGFFKGFYSLCYRQFYMFEKGVTPKDTSDLNSDEILCKILELRDSYKKIPIKDVKHISCSNHFYYVRNIFQVYPKRYGMYGDDLIWESFILYFRLFEVSLDVLSFDDIIDSVSAILYLYYKYSNHHCVSAIKKYWDENLYVLTKLRYTMWTEEMKQLT